MCGLRFRVSEPSMCCGLKVVSLRFVEPSLQRRRTPTMPLSTTSSDSLMCRDMGSYWVVFEYRIQVATQSSTTNRWYYWVQSPGCGCFAKPRPMPQYAVVERRMSTRIPVLRPSRLSLLVSSVSCRQQSASAKKSDPVP